MGWDSKLLPDKILRLMSAADRREYARGQLTGEEALEAARVRSERDLQNLAERYFRLRGVVAVRARMDKATTTAVGTPDFLLSLAGLGGVAVEFKLPGEELTPEQEAMKLKMTTPPNCWHWVTARSLDDIKQLLHTY